MSPTTPTHLALPPGKIPQQQFLSGYCWRVLSGCNVPSHNQRRWRLFVYWLVSFSLRCRGRGTTPRCHLSPNYFPSHPTYLSYESSHFLAVTSSALTLTRDTHDKLGVEVKVMGCESNAPAPHFTHCGHVQEGGQTHKYTSIACVCTIS